MFRLCKDGRSLKNVEAEAETVRRLYALYLEEGSLTAVKARAKSLGLRSRERAGKAAVLGFTNIHYILTNPTYAGLIRHRRQTYPGHHPAIIDPALFDVVQEKLKAAGAFERGPRGAPPRQSPLAGKLFDETGDRFTPMHSTSNGRRITYYISSRLLKAGRLDRAAPDRGWRLPGRKLEEVLDGAIAAHLTAAMPGLLLSGASAQEIAMARDRLQAIHPPPDGDGIKAVLSILKRADLSPGEAKLQLDHKRLSAFLALPEERISVECLIFKTPFLARKRGQETQLVIGMDPPGRQDPILIRNIARAQAIYAEVKHGKSFADIAKSEQLSVRRIMQFLDLAFLSPAIVRQILAGKQPLALTTKWFLTHALSSDWQAQQRVVDGL